MGAELSVESQHIQQYRRAEAELAALRAGGICTTGAENELLDEMDDLWQIMSREDRISINSGDHRAPTQTLTIGE